MIRTLADGRLRGPQNILKSLACPVQYTAIVNLFKCKEICSIQWHTQEFCSVEGGSTNSVEDRGQREQGSGGGSPLVKGSGGSCNFV